MSIKQITIIIILGLVALVFFFPDFFITNFLNHSVPAIFASLGIASTILLLMYLHYLTKKINFKKLVKLTNDSIKIINEVIDTFSPRANEIYKLYGAKDNLDFLTKMMMGTIKPSQMAIDTLQGINDNLSKYTSRKFNLQMELMYYENYSFMKYFLAHLNRIYPDEYLKSLFKNGEIDN